jgi:single-stranded-DNA-specific exonuclease
VLPRPADPAVIALLERELRLPTAACRLLIARGLSDPETAKRFLRPRLDQLHRPELLLGLDAAVARLAAAVRARETVFIHGDYDVDGMCSTTLLTRTIRELGGVAVPFIPRRLEDGYDLSGAGVAAARAAGAGVVVTCDCGTSAREPIAELTRGGIDVIVTDHHLPGGPLPECLAVLNPKQPGCPYPDKDLAAVGVVFKLALALVRALGGNENAVLRRLDLVAVATVADLAPLRGENRVLVRYGLKMLAETDNVGLRALIRASGLEGKALTAGRVGFTLAPRLNAVGRLSTAMRGLELLLAEDDRDAHPIARELEELNRRRQEVDRMTLVRARELLEAIDLDATFGIVLAEEGWHPGVIGIVASRIVETCGRPTVLIALADGEGKGSGRSIGAFDLHAGLSECRDLLLRFGGHRSAAGVTIARDKVAEFARRFDEVARARLTPDDLVPEVRIDLELPLAEATAELEAVLRHFEPYGLGNPCPAILSSGVRLARPPRVVKGDALKLCLTDGRVELDAIGWDLGYLATELEEGAALDVVFRLERDDWQGTSRLQAKLVEVRT